MSNEIDSEKSLILVDDHEMILLGLKNFLESKNSWKVRGLAKSIESAKSLLQGFFADGGLPQIIVIDIELGEENGFDLALYVRENFPAIKIIMYTMHDESDYVLKSRQLKIDGYISKASGSEEFLKCLDTVYSGKEYLEGRLVERQELIEEAVSLLTKREVLIFREMLNGKSNMEISQTLNLTKHSVEVYATTIYEKLFCNGRAELLKKYR
ncbi:MAG: response regulator transcription factor [Treponema sp.]|nr:response regulator transcription factor [Treponema sp.]